MINHASYEAKSNNTFIKQFIVIYFAKCCIYILSITIIANTKYKQPQFHIVL